MAFEIVLFSWFVVCFARNRSDSVDGYVRLFVCHEHCGKQSYLTIRQCINVDIALFIVIITLAYSFYVRFLCRRHMPWLKYKFRVVF